MEATTTAPVHGPWRKIVWGSAERITEEQAKEIQEQLGYPVAGYGFGRFHTKKVEGGYLAEWVCADSCD